LLNLRSAWTTENLSIIRDHKCSVYLAESIRILTNGSSVNLLDEETKKIILDMDDWIQSFLPELLRRLREAKLLTKDNFNDIVPHVSILSIAYTQYNKTYNNCLYIPKELFTQKVFDETIKICQRESGTGHPMQEIKKYLDEVKKMDPKYKPPTLS